ncbi:MAG TPA: hypothetical protein VHE30_19900 [Polyangiaceae bacterium]|nr:hypothetical protein [Polyangiaceae bacterium]
MSTKAPRGPVRRALGAAALSLLSLLPACGARRGGGAASAAAAGELAAASGEGPELARVPGGPETCGNARDDDGNGFIDDGCGLRAGLVQFVIAWDAPTADVDLLVTDPKGELADVGRPTSSGLVKERDCPGRHAECKGKNFENVFLEKEEAKRGTYKVSIRLERLEEEDAPIVVTLGARIGPRTFERRVALSRPEDHVDLSFLL